jgi:hypothetical protein
MSYIEYHSVYVPSSELGLAHPSLADDLRKSLALCLLCGVEYYLMVFQGLERDVPMDLELMKNLRTLDDLVYEVQLAGADITALEQLSNLEQETHLGIHLLKPSA